MQNVPPRTATIPHQHGIVSSSHPGSDASTAVDKALGLLHIFEGAESVGVSELARRANLSKSTAFRLLSILQRNGAVEKDGSRYRLGRKLYDLGRRVYERQPGRLRELTLPFLTELYERTHETIHLAVLHDIDVVYLEKLYGHRLVRSPSRIGGRVPAYCTAVGKVLLSHDLEATDRTLTAGLVSRTSNTIVDESRLLAELGQIRRTGIAFDNEESVPRLTCVAVPILDERGQPVAAISVAGDRSRFDPSTTAYTLRSSAAAASQMLRRQMPMG